MSAERELSMVKSATRSGLIAGLMALVLYLMSVDATLIAFWAFTVFMGSSFHPFAGFLAAGVAIWASTGATKEKPTAEKDGKKFDDRSGTEGQSAGGKTGKRSSVDRDDLEDLPF